MESRVREWAWRRGYEVTWFSGSVLRDALREIERMKEEEQLSRALLDEHLSWLNRPEILAQADAETIILAAVPRPAHVISFEHSGESHDLVLPPTYHGYTDLFESVRDDLEEFLERRMGLRVLQAPLKTLAAWSGLARYGRNNLTYVEGFGSYIQLVGFTADVPLGESVAADSSSRSMLERCRKCRACIKACPVGAISDQRFLLYADRCLTFHSELDGDLPESFATLPRRCIVGCMACQESCPENRGRLRIEPLGERFTEEDTAVILGEAEDTRPSQGLIDRVSRLKSSELQLTSDGPSRSFRRNLAAVLRHSDRTSAHNLGKVS